MPCPQFLSNKYIWVTWCILKKIYIACVWSCRSSYAGLSHPTSACVRTWHVWISDSCKNACSGHVLPSELEAVQGKVPYLHLHFPHSHPTSLILWSSCWTGLAAAFVTGFLRCIFFGSSNRFGNLNGRFPVQSIMDIACLRNLFLWWCRNFCNFLCFGFHSCSSLGAVVQSRWPTQSTITRFLCSRRLGCIRAFDGCWLGCSDSGRSMFLPTF